MPGRDDRPLGSSARAAATRAADLVNVLLTGEPDVEAVRAVLVSHGEQEPLDLTAADLPRLREAAQRLRTVFAATTVTAAADALNELLVRHARPPRLTTHEGAHPWHVHVDSHDDAPWDEWLIASSCLALANLLADRQHAPGGLCASASCRRAFAELGGGSPRRYCSTRCATRERVAAHRRRE